MSWSGCNRAGAGLEIVDGADLGEVAQRATIVDKIRIAAGRAAKPDVGRAKRCCCRRAVKIEGPPDTVNERAELGAVGDKLIEPQHESGVADWTDWAAAF